MTFLFKSLCFFVFADWKISLLYLVTNRCCILLLQINQKHPVVDVGWWSAAVLLSSTFYVRSLVSTDRYKFGVRLIFHYRPCILHSNFASTSALESLGAYSWPCVSDESEDRPRIATHHTRAPSLRVAISFSRPFDIDFTFEGQLPVCQRAPRCWRIYQALCSKSESARTDNNLSLVSLPTSCICD